MGLDITAYSKLIKAADITLDEDGEPSLEDWRTHTKTWIHPDWPERGIGLEDNTWYTYGQSMGFRAGSYSGYNDWRERLAKLAGYPATETESASFGSRSLHSAACWNGANGVFSELIDFSDCEGTLGPEVSKKLLSDFIRRTAPSGSTRPSTPDHSSAPADTRTTATSSSRHTATVLRR